MVVCWMWLLIDALYSHLFEASVEIKQTYTVKIID